MGQRSLCMASTAVLTLFLGACSVGPDFERPMAPKADFFAGEQLREIEGGDSGVSQKFVVGEDISGTWWSLFRSESLNKLVAQAMASNPNLQAAEAALRAAQEGFYAGAGAFLPSVNGGSGFTREKTSQTTSTGKIYNLYNASVGVSYNLDVFGGTRRRVEALGAKTDEQRFQLEAAYLSLTSNVVTAAIQEAALRAQLDAMREIVQQQGKQLETMQKQMELGGVARSAVLAQEATLAQTKAALPQLEKNLAKTRHLLGVLAGRFPSDELGVNFDLDKLELPQTLPLSLPSKLVEQRPDIRAAEARLHAASAEVGVATANMLPQITLSADMGSIASKLGDVFASGTGLWSLAGGIAQPLFHGGALYHAREASKAAFEAEAALYRATVLSAFQEVADVLRALQKDAESLQAQTIAERSAFHNLEISQRQFEVGVISYPALLMAEQNYQQAKIEFVKAQATRLADTAALFQALGGGWWNRTDDVDDKGAAENKAVSLDRIQDGDKK